MYDHCTVWSLIHTSNHESGIGAVVWVLVTNTFARVNVGIPGGWFRWNWPVYGCGDLRCSLQTTWTLILSSLPSLWDVHNFVVIYIPTKKISGVVKDDKKTILKKNLRIVLQFVENIVIYIISQVIISFETIELFLTRQVISYFKFNL